MSKQQDQPDSPAAGNPIFLSSSGAVVPTVVQVAAFVPPVPLSCLVFLKKNHILVTVTQKQLGW